MKPLLIGILAGIVSNIYLANLVPNTYGNYQQTREPNPIQADVKGRGETVHAVPSISYTPSPRPTEGNIVREEEHPIPAGESKSLSGTASFYTNEYCEKYNPLCITASGEVFDDTQFTTACSSAIPLGSTLLVKHGDASIQVRCNDRGSFEGKYNRILDLSKASFEALSPLSKGVIEVRVEIYE